MPAARIFLFVIMTFQLQYGLYATGCSVIPVLDDGGYRRRGVGHV